MKDIKVKFKGAFAPSGKRTGVQYMAGKARVDQWKKNKNFDMEIEMPKAKAEPKKAPKAKKEKE
jgi:hypothetical protein